MAGNVVLVAAMLLMLRGLRLFVGRPTGDRLALAAWLGATAVCAASLVEPGLVAWRIATVALIVGLVSLASMAEVVRYARQHLSWAWSLAIGLPMLFAAVVFVARGVTALAMQPTSVTASGLAFSFGFAVAIMLASLVSQLTLLGVVASRLGGDLRRAARHDALTGLLNRRAGEELLADEAQRARRLGEDFALLMLDLDFFKQINDRHGHAAGDRALQHSATLLGAHVREIDRLVRWGGEEFVVLLPGTSQPDACALAQRLCDRVRSQPLVWHEQSLPMTASVGVASWAGADDSVAQLLARADAALYEAKRGGRDRDAAA